MPRPVGDALSDAPSAIALSTPEHSTTSDECADAEGPHQQTLHITTPLLEAHVGNPASRKPLAQVQTREDRLDTRLIGCYWSERSGRSPTALPLVIRACVFILHGIQSWRIK
jgi:hypothetical protein